MENNKFYRRRKTKYFNRGSLVNFFLVLMVLLMSISMISAFEWDNVKKFDKDVGKYGKITIKNAFGFGSTLAEYELTDNTDYCFVNCYAEGNVKLNYDGRLFNDINFYGKEKQKEKKEITNNIFYKKNNKWKEYNGEYLKAGTYEWRIEGTKKPNEKVDWIVSTLGKDLTEWAWWNASFEKKKAITITENNNTELANYSIYMNITYDSDMATDFSDIRFTDTNEITPLSYYIENYTTGINATVWVKMASNITASGTKDIYMYYDNTTAVSTTSSFNNAFLFADDFETDTSANWNYTNCDGGFAISGGKMRITETSGVAGYQCTVSPKDPYQYLSTNYEVTSKSEAPGASTYIMTSTGYMATNRTYPYIATQLIAGGNDAAKYLNLLQVNAPLTTTDLNKSETSRGFSVDTNYTLSLQLYGTYAKAIKEVSNSPAPGNVRMELPYDGLTYPTSGVYGMSAYEGDTASVTTDIHEWRVRPFVINEPTYSFGEEMKLLNIYHNNPLNGTNLNSKTVTFNCSAIAYDDSGVNNITLYIDGLQNETITNTTFQNLSLQTTLGDYSEGEHNWNCSAVNGNLIIVNGSQQFFTVDTIYPTILVNKPLTFPNISYVSYNETLNFTITDANIDTVWYYYNGTNTTIPDVVSGTSRQTTFLFEESNRTLILYVNDSANNINSTTINLNYSSYENSQTYNSITTGSSNESFTLNLTYNSGDWIGESAKLNYNGTEYTSTKIKNGDNLIFNNSIIVPNPLTSTNYSFFWNVTLTSLTGATYSVTTTSSQLVTPIIPINVTSLVCSAGYSSAFNFTSLIESNLSTINFTSVSYNLQYGSSGNASILTANGSFTNVPSFNICINSSLSYYVGYGEIQYEVTGYSDRRFYIFDNTRLVNTTISNNLYSLETASSTAFQITAQDTNLRAYEGYYITLLRWYPSLNEYKIVDMGKTDSNGQTVINVKTQDVDYRLGLYQPDGTLVKLLDPIRMICQTTPCVYSLIVDIAEIDLTTFLNIESNLSWNPTTKIFTYIFNDASQDTTGMNLTVWQDTPDSGSNIICTTSSTSFTGILVCDVSAYSGQLRAEVYRSASPLILIDQLIVNIRNSLVDVSGGKTITLFIGLILVITMALMGVTSPPLVIILTLVGFIPLLILGGVTWAIFMIIGALAGIVLHMLRRVGG